MTTTGLHKADAQASTDHDRWSPARIYLLASGVFLAFTASVGFLLDRSFPTSPDAVYVHTGTHIFGIFETNGWHNLAGILSAVAALVLASRPRWSRPGALAKGVVYVGVTAAIAIFGPETFLIESNTADQILHGSLAAGGLVTGLLTRRAGKPAPLASLS